MRKFFAVILLPLFCFAEAQASTTVEAFLSQSSFDGRMFDYKFIAYDTKEVLRQEPKVSCEFSLMDQKIILSAVKVSVLLEADFNQPSAKVEGAGQLDVRKAIKDCQRQLSFNTRSINAPVQIKLPPLSVPSAQQ